MVKSFLPKFSCTASPETYQITKLSYFVSVADIDAEERVDDSFRKKDFEAEVFRDFEAEFWSRF